MMPPQPPQFVGHALFSPGVLERAPAQAFLAIACTISLAILWWFFPAPSLEALAAAPIIISTAILLTIWAVRFPFSVALGLVFFTYFKFDDAFPVLSAFKLVFVCATLTLLAGAWHLWISRSVEPSWPTELKALVAFFVIVSVGLLFSLNKTVALGAWLVYWKIVALTLIISWLPRRLLHFQQFARALIMGGIIIATVTIYNGKTGLSTVEVSRAVAGGGSLSNPNDVAMLLLIPLAFCIAFLFVRSGKFNTTLAGLGTLTILWGIILTQSRGGLLGILAILALAGSRVIKNKVVLCSIGAVAAVALYGAMAISDRISGGDQDVQGLSAQNRIYAWGAGIRMAAARPLTGVGLGNFANQSQNFSSALDREYTAHSVWFLVLGETGLPGFVAFMVMVVAGLLTSIRNNARVSQACSVPLLKAVSLSLTGALIGFLVTGCFGSYAYHWPLYVLLAFIVALDRYLAASNQLNAFISRSSAEVGDPAGLPRSDV